MKSTKKKYGIEEALNKIFKKVKSDPIDEDETNPDEDLEIEDSVSEDEETSENNDDEEIVYDFDEDEPEEASDDEVEDEIPEDELEDSEIEKSEDGEINEDEPVEDSDDEEEEVEDEEDEDVDEIDYEELLNRIKDDLGVQELSAQVDDLAENVKRVVDLLEINTDTSIANNEKNVELEKSLEKLTKKLSKVTRIRKSVKNAKINDKYGDSKKSIDDLSKSQKASILSSEFLAGNKDVTSLDVTRAEQGAPLSAECISVIEKHIR